VVGFDFMRPALFLFAGGRLDGHEIKMMFDV